MASTNPIILITGANTGLGLATIKSLLQSPITYKILLGCRSLEKGNTAAKAASTKFPDSKTTIKTIQIDVENDDSILKAFGFVQREYGHLDVLVNNAYKLPIHLQVFLGERKVANKRNRSCD